jgi:hypothetical protein
MAENIQGKNPEGSTAAHTNPVLIAGKDAAGNIVDLLLDVDGTLHVNGAITVAGSNVEQTNGSAAAAKSNLVAGKSPSGEGIPLSVDESGNLNVSGITLTASNIGISSNISSVASALVVGAKTVIATAAELFAGGSAKTTRRQLIIRNEDPALRLRVGPSSVTQQNGYPIEPGGTLEISFDPATAVAIYGISEGAGLQVEVTEI